MGILNKIKRRIYLLKQAIIPLQEQFGKKQFQAEFVDLFWKALRGLNIGTGDEFATSGELHILHELKDKYFKITDAPWVIFDVGANVGNYTKAITDIFSDSNYHLYCFEPSAKTFEILANNLSKSEKVSLINLGMSNKESKQILYTDNDGSGMASLTKRNLEYRNIHMDKSEEVNLTTIDIFCKQNKINQIDFLKLDIEGFELDALNGGIKMINRDAIKYIQFEFGGCNIDTRTYFKDFFFFLKEKYSIYRVLQDGLIEIPEYHEVHEQFNTTNYFAINKNI